MAETPWINNVSGIVASSEQVLMANTAINLYGCKAGDDLRISKKGPDAKFYPHVVDGSDSLGKRNTSFILLTGGTYQIVGKVTGPLYVTHEAI